VVTTSEQALGEQTAGEQAAGEQAAGEQTPSKHRDTPRSRQRAQTKAEILAAALHQMAEDGVAGLNLSTVAGRVGLKQPSLYRYFPSRAAVYDALFELAASMQRDAAVAAAAHGAGGWSTLRDVLYSTAHFVAAEPILAQLLFTRPVPGFSPSATAYGPSLEVMQISRDAVQDAVARGDLSAAAATEEGIRLLIALVGGVINHYAANEPDVKDYSPLLEPALAMYAEHFRPRRGRPAD
jgi:AcrR family transcriptional regulator